MSRGVGGQQATRWGSEQRQREEALLAEIAELPADDPRRATVRDELVTMHLPLVRYLARRYRDRGESEDDLVQAGTIGLISAVDRFDPSRGVQLSTYATPTILGGIRRHFRDRAWAIHVPRRLQELQGRLPAITDQLTVALNRSPTVRELAEALGVGPDEILEALEARHAYAPGSLDAQRDEQDGGSSSIVERIGIEDPALDAVEDREALRAVLAALPDRERRIVMLRFFQDRSQSEIAEELGISQMHVSRLLARSLTTLRVGLSDLDPRPPAAPPAPGG